jgi:hypothetical protein
MLFFDSMTYLIGTKKKGLRGGQKAQSARPKEGDRWDEKMSEDRTDLIEKVDMNNERFSSYYQAQKIIPEDEWELLLDSFRQPLPTTFRVAGSRQYLISKFLREAIMNGTIGRQPL